jgi:hypothetical protein
VACAGTLCCVLYCGSTETRAYGITCYNIAKFPFTKMCFLLRTLLASRKSPLRSQVEVSYKWKYVHIEAFRWITPFVRHSSFLHVKLCECWGRLAINNVSQTER